MTLVTTCLDASALGAQRSRLDLNHERCQRPQTPIAFAIDDGERTTLRECVKLLMHPFIGD